MHYTRVLTDSDLAALRGIRGVVADSNHPSKGALIAALDGVIAPPAEVPAAYRFTQTFYSCHEPELTPNEGLALRLVRLKLDGSEVIVTHNPIGAPTGQRVLAYTATVVVAPPQRQDDPR